MRKLTHQELLSRQREHLLKNSKIPVVVVLNNIRSLHNVGSIFRTCDGAGIEKLWLCGLTGYPPNPQLAKTALGAERQVYWEYQKDIFALLKELKESYEIVFLEQTSRSISYVDFHPKRPVCLVVGNEIEGVTEQILDLCDAAIEIEMAGAKNSLNVSVAFGIVAYHMRYYLTRQ